MTVGAYRAVRDWVDRQWRAGALQFKILLLPVIVPLLLAGMIGGVVPYASAMVWFGVWNSFVAWRYWFYLKELAREGDAKYDREDKFRLAEEYHPTESASAAADRRRAGRDNA